MRKILVFLFLLFYCELTQAKTVELICEMETMGTKDGAWKNLGPRTFFLKLNSSSRTIEINSRFDDFKFKRKFRILSLVDGKLTAVQIERDSTSVRFKDTPGITVIAFDSNNGILSYANTFARSPRSYSTHYGNCK
tara:strand:- start:676 stop:1083 length:408 start_codon:yes stop_codon:yes gene_type:complete